MGGSGETLAGPPAGSGAVTAGAALASLPAQEAPGPTMGLPSSWCCVYVFLPDTPSPRTISIVGGSRSPRKVRQRSLKGRGRRWPGSAASEVTPPGRGQRWREDVKQEARPRFRWLEEAGRGGTWGRLALWREGGKGWAGREGRGARRGAEGRRRGQAGPLVIQAPLKAGHTGDLEGRPWTGQPC